MGNILIGCRLPHGLTISHPNPAIKTKVTIAGMNTSKVIGSTHVTTEVDADFWEAWKTVYSDFAPLKNGSIFDARSVTDAAAKAKDLRKEKTGFEPMAKDAGGVKPSDKK